MEKIPPVHPREILLEEFLQPMDISQNQAELANGRHNVAIGAVFWGDGQILAWPLA